MLSRAEIDLGNIQEDYRRLYKISLEDHLLKYASTHTYHVDKFYARFYLTLIGSKHADSAITPEEIQRYLTRGRHMPVHV